MKWENIDKAGRTTELKVGDIIRTKTNKPESKDGYIYGRATGGFGMHTFTIGRAIYVDNEAWSYEECKNKVSKDTARWNRGDYYIEVERAA